MDIWSAISLVTGGLSLVAFVVAAFAVSYSRKLQSKETQLATVPDAQKPQALETLAEWMRVDLEIIPPNRRERLVIEQLRNKRHAQQQTTWIIVAVAVLLTIVALAAVLKDLFADPPPPPTPSVAAPAPTPVVYKICIGEKSGSCGAEYSIHYGCGTDINKLAATLCENQERGIVLRGTRGGNKCGYGWYEVTCPMLIKK